MEPTVCPIRLAINAELCINIDEYIGKDRDSSLLYLYRGGSRGGVQVQGAGCSAGGNQLTNQAKQLTK